MDSGYVVVMPGCSSNCIFCAIAKQSFDEPKEVKNRLSKEFARIREEGKEKLVISGSDPLDLTNITKIVSMAKEAGFNCIQIATHGMPLSDKKLSKRIAAAGPVQFTIPLYGGKAVTHDAVTQVKGSLYKTLKGILNIGELNRQVMLSSLILQQNKDDLINLVKLIERLPVKNLSINMTYMSSNNADEFYVPQKDLPGVLNPLVDYILRQRKRMWFQEFPYCVFYPFSKTMFKSGLVEHKTMAYEHIGEKKTPEELPWFKEKCYAKICDECKVKPFCDGFFKADIQRFGTGDLRPL